MHIELSNSELKELKDLKDIFVDSYVNDEKVICFDFLFDLINNKEDIENLTEETKKMIKRQLNESNDWLLSICCTTKLIDKLISFFCS